MRGEWLFRPHKISSRLATHKPNAIQHTQTLQEGKTKANMLAIDCLTPTAALMTAAMAAHRQVRGHFKEEAAADSVSRLLFLHLELVETDCQVAAAREKKQTQTASHDSTWSPQCPALCRRSCLPCPCPKRYPPPRWSWAMNQGSSRICKPLWTWRLLVAADPHARRKLDRVKTQLWDLAG